MLSDQHRTLNSTGPSCSISRLNSVYDTRPREYLLSTIFKEMQRGNAALADTVCGKNDFTLQSFKCPQTPTKRYSETSLIDDASETINRILEKAPPLINIHTLSFPHWTEEERIVVKETLSLNGRPSEFGTCQKCGDIITDGDSTFPLSKRIF